MPLKPELLAPIPEETARVAHAALPKGNPCLRLRDGLGTLFQDDLFVDLFPTRDQPAEAPWRLALISTRQFMEGLGWRSPRSFAQVTTARLILRFISLARRLYFERQAHPAALEPFPGARILRLAILPGPGAARRLAVYSWFEHFAWQTVMTVSCPTVATNRII